MRSSRDFFFLQNNQIPQTISLVIKVLKLFSNLTNQVCQTRFCSLKSSEIQSSFSWKLIVSHSRVKHSSSIAKTPTQSKVETNFPNLSMFLVLWSDEVRSLVGKLSHRDSSSMELNLFTLDLAPTKSSSLHSICQIDKQFKNLAN